MKKSLLPIIGLMAGSLVACGGSTGGASTADSKTSTPKSSEKTSKASSSKHTHTFDESKWESDASGHWHPATCEHASQKGNQAAHDFEEVAAESKAATCKAAGVKVEKCKVCGYKKTTELPAGPHAWVEKSKSEKEGESKYKIQECSECHVQDVCVDAMTYTALEGSLKSAPDKSLKLNKNGDHADYKFTIDKGFTGRIAVFGWVDYFKDGSNNNESKGFFSRKEGEGANLEVSINGAAVEIDNHKTYEEMGMGVRDDGTTNSTPALCDIANASFAAGEVNVVYKRIESYNLNITEIHFIGELK